ncbi:hypothetical protein Poli38472_007011 [Pythium oligandrum]|uniref:Uncharacterized protein n=1 Tax=Pythium oligandrum TaxID=41045 RepID=A0A8K1C8X9_PYTOL|nr:hypothetical protein Poli38472_007011 [Pythium oligandrum]|eukprot:TMW58866.1 hypothetical protein Poli38472_007011 [Pythium oligandrum]
MMCRVQEASKEVSVAKRRQEMIQRLAQEAQHLGVVSDLPMGFTPFQAIEAPSEGISTVHMTYKPIVYDLVAELERLEAEMPSEQVASWLGPDVKRTMATVKKERATHATQQYKPHTSAPSHRQSALYLALVAEQRQLRLQEHRGFTTNAA